MYNKVKSLPQCIGWYQLFKHFVFQFKCGNTILHLFIPLEPLRIGTDKITTRIFFDVGNLKKDGSCFLFDFGRCQENPADLSPRLKEAETIATNTYEQSKRLRQLFNI